MTDLTNLQNEINKLYEEKMNHEAEISRLHEEMTTLVKIEAIPSDRHESTSTVYASKFLEDFSVISLLGQGGFGCVFEAENRYDCWKYAVKRVAVNSNKSSMEKALVEVRAMAQLDHPNIVRYNSTWVEEPPEGWQYEADDKIMKNIREKHLKKDYGEKCSFIYIQMQMCEYSLAKWLEDDPTMSLREITRMKSWFKQIVSAVSYIHDKNLIHRDLKPSNILFVEENRLKICDLGIAAERRDEDENETDFTRTFAGTKIYMSPEQLDYSKTFKVRYSSKADVFSLGLIFAELCVVMKHPERKMIFDNFRRGIQCNRITDRKTVDFIEKITRVEPKHRISCRDMLDHLYLS